MTTLSDLQLNTAFTMIEAIYIDGNCSTSALPTVTEWRTAWARGTPYPAEGLVNTWKSPEASI